MPLALAGRRQWPGVPIAPVENCVPKLKIVLGALLGKQGEKSADVRQDPFERELPCRSDNFRAQLVRLIGERRSIGHPRIALESGEHHSEPSISNRLTLWRRIVRKIGRV